MARAQGKNSPRRIQASQRRDEALKLRLMGLSESAIGKRLGVSQPAVSKMLTEVMKPVAESIREQSSTLRALEVERLDALLQALWPRAVRRSGADGEVIEADVMVVDRVLKIAKRRAELLGLDISDHNSISIDTMPEEFTITLKR